MTSPTQRTLEKYRKEGWTCEVVEHWVQLPGRPGFRKDFLGCIDVLAFSASRPGVLGIQATSWPNISTRLVKAKAIPALEIWLNADNRFLVIGWKKVGNRWQCKEVEVTLEGLLQGISEQLDEAGDSLAERPG